MRKLLDDYLDGTLQAGERAELERLLASDSEAAKLLAAMNSERALRQAAYQSFQPSVSEAQDYAGKTIAAIHAEASRPAGYVGNFNRWLRRGLAVAAAIAIVAGSFAMGRITATTTTVKQTVVKAEPQVVYRVVYFAETGDKEVREFASMDEANDFVSKLDAKRAEPQVAAVDLDHSGSF